MEVVLSVKTNLDFRVHVVNEIRIHMTIKTFAYGVPVSLVDNLVVMLGLKNLLHYSVRDSKGHSHVV